MNDAVFRDLIIEKSLRKALITIDGGFTSEKITLANALIGHKVVLGDIPSITGNSIIIDSGFEKDRVIRHFSNGTTREWDSLTEYHNEMFESDNALEESSSWINEYQLAGNVIDSDICFYISSSLHNDFNHLGIVFADVIIYAMSAMQPVNKKKLEILKSSDYQEKHQSLFFTVDSWDLIEDESEDEKAEIKQYFESILKIVFEQQGKSLTDSKKEQRLFFISTRNALKDRSHRAVGYPSAVSEHENDFSRLQKELIAFLNTTIQKKQDDRVISDCLSELRSIVKEIGSEYYESMLSEIEGRYFDPELKIAVIGDFNTGKSTFLNALLKKDVLSMSNIPTTVIPTYIKWDGKERSVPAFTITLAGDDKGYSVSNPADHAYLQEKLGMAFEDSAQGIESIITNNAMIKRVVCANISYPVDPRFKNICLIDTPGVNPGAEETVEHANITREVLQKDADSTIILFPSFMPGQKASMDYAYENAFHLLSNALFVITKMDIVEGEKDEKKIVPYMKGLLKQRFDIDIETVYTCSARNALYYYTGHFKYSHYADAFENMITQMISEINANRNRIVCNKMTVMIQSLIKEIKEDQKKVKQKLVKVMDLLKQYSFGDLELEYQRMLESYKENITDEGNRIKGRISGSMDSINKAWLKKVYDEIDKVSSSRDMREYVATTLQYRVGEYESIVNEAIDRDYMTLRDIYNAFAKDVEICFKKHGVNVGKLSSRDYSPTVISLQISNSSSRSLKLQKKKESILFEVEKAINTAKPNEKWLQTISSLVKQYTDDAARLKDKYRESNQELFNERTNEQNEKKTDLEIRLSKSSEILKKLEQIENKLQEIDVLV